MANQQGKDARASGGILGALLLLGALVLSACAGLQFDDVARARAVAAKSVVDVTVSGYTTYCEELRRPKCDAENEAARNAGISWDREDRISCLRPCNSATAEKLGRRVRVVVSAQIAVWRILAIAQGDSPELREADEVLRKALVQLDELLGPIQEMLR